MMKRLLIIFLMLIIAVTTLSADIALTYDSADDRYFDSPARLVEIEEKIPFAFMLDLDSDIDTLRFFSNPAGTLEESALALASFLRSQDLSFWENNIALIGVFSSLSANFPSDVTSPTFMAAVDDYFSSEFLSDEYGDNRRAWAVANSLDLISAYQNPSSILGGRLDMGLSLYGGEVKNGFGWDYQVNFNYNNSDSLLSSFRNRISIDARSNLGYAFHIGSEKFAFGFAFQPQLRFETEFTNGELLSARLSDSFIDLIANNNLNFGFGLGLNLGFLYRHSHEWSFTLDLRDVPTFQTFFYLIPSELLTSPQMHRDDTFYFLAPDVALSVLWEKDRYHVNVELSDIVNQVIWHATTSYSFDYFSILKLRFKYDLDSDLSLIAKYEYRAIAFAVSWHELYAEISTRLDRGAVGMKLGYRF